MARADELSLSRSVLGRWGVKTSDCEKSLYRSHHRRRRAPWQSGKRKRQVVCTSLARARTRGRAPWALLWLRPAATSGPWPTRAPDGPIPTPSTTSAAARSPRPSTRSWTARASRLRSC
eukprot:366232-Chlamydomonas_euryale.AAC.19